MALYCADRYVALAVSVEKGWRDLTEKGILEFDSSKLVVAREKLESEMERYRKDWPMISLEQIESALRRYVAAARDATFDDAARALGHVPDEAPRELPVTGWDHLVTRRHPWKRQLFLQGRNMTVRQLVGTVRASGWSDEEAAKELDFPPEAIREAIRYADANKELLAAEAEYEYLYMARRGLWRDTRPLPR